MSKIAIIGGGISGSTAALYLANIGLDVTLFEKKESLISGPPFCHLHAGGNLYPNIPDDECVTLLHQSIDLLRFYPYSIDYRPTVIAIPKDQVENPSDLLPRLELLKKEYQNSIDLDLKNNVLGNSENYYKLFSKDDILKLKDKKPKDKPSTLDEWMIPVSKYVDLEKLKFPLIMVQEYGLNLFAMASSITLSLEKLDKCILKFNTKVNDIKETKNGYIINNESFDYVINAAGFRSGTIDDMLGYKRDRLVEFKAAYVTKWEQCNTIWPEVVFHGKRGTPQGMGQFTPYQDGYFQLHGMTEDITLFENGLVANDHSSSYPKLAQKFIDKIDKNWHQKDIETRTKKAIQHLCKFIPGFCGSSVASKPLYGAQQIPGTNKELRAADVSFEGKRYARCEVVKASSVLTMIDLIVEKLIKLDLVDEKYYNQREFENIKLDQDDIDKFAKMICKQREYPQSLAIRNMTSN
jgi:hypothetical protein